MTTLWRAIVCLFHREACPDGFAGDETTDFLSDAKRRARDQEIASWREVDRITKAEQEQRGVANTIIGRPRRD